MARKKYEEQPEEETFFFEDENEKPNQKGNVVMITPKRIIIEYGIGLGTNIEFIPEMHSHLKVGDRIDVP